MTGTGTGRPGRRVPPGLAGERTVLAWQRTALGVVAGSLLLALRGLALDEPWSATLAGALAVLTTLGAVLLLPRGGPGARLLPPWQLLLVAAGAVIALGALGVIAGLASLLH